MSDTTTTATETATITEITAAPARDGEQLGVLVFDTRADWLAQSGGLWVYPASYDDLRLCQRRAAHLSEVFGVDFFSVHIPTPYFMDGPSPATRSGAGWYPATLAENTPELRRIVTRGLERARALAPRESAETPETAFARQMNAPLTARDRAIIAREYDRGLRDMKAKAVTPESEAL